MPASFTSRVILPCKLEQTNSDPQGNCHRLGQKKINQQILHGSGCSCTTGSRGVKKCEVWKRS